MKTAIGFPSLIAVDLENDLGINVAIVVFIVGC
jgi:uncharacterized membrane protein